MISSFAGPWSNVTKYARCIKTMSSNFFAAAASQHITAQKTHPPADFPATTDGGRTRNDKAEAAAYYYNKKTRVALKFSAATQPPHKKEDTPTQGSARP